MLQIWFATTNEGKAKSAQRRLEPLGITVMPTSMELNEKQIDDLEIIAAMKAEQAFAKLQKPVFVIDAGFHIHAYDNGPGAYAKSFFQKFGVKGILRLMRGEKDRSCEFVHVLAYKDEILDQPKIFSGIVGGSIARKASGNNKTYAWSIAYRIFIPDGHTKTQGDMSDEEQLQFREETSSYYAEFAHWYVHHIRALYRNGTYSQFS